MKELKQMTVCFTGHRRVPDGIKPTLEAKLYKTVLSMIKSGYRYFGVGGAVGFDTLAAKTILSLRREYPYIRLILVLPCKNQTAKWRSEDVDMYNRILSECDKAVYISDHYTGDCMHRRNRHLVDCGSVCVCYQTVNTGGTAYTVRYAVDKGFTVINLA